MQRFVRSLFVIGALAAFAAVAPAAHGADHTDGLLVLDAGAAALLWVPPFTSDQEVLWQGDPFVRPTDLILGPNGSLVIIDPGAGELFGIDPFAGMSPFRFPTGGIGSDSCWIARLDATDFLLSGPGGLIHLDVGGANPVQTPLPTELVDPFDVTVDAGGSILVADPGASALISVDPNDWKGTPLAQLDSCWIANGPNGEIVTAGPGGVFLISDPGEPVSLNVGVADPTAVAFDSHGALFVADRGAPALAGGPEGSPPAVIRFDLQTGAQTLMTSGGFLQDPAAILLVPEPSGALALASGVALLALMGRRRIRRQREHAPRSLWARNSTR